MKKVVALAVALGLAACAPKEAPKPAMDSAAAAPAMSADTGMKADSMKKDSTMAPAAAPATKPAAH